MSGAIFNATLANYNLTSALLQVPQAKNHISRVANKYGQIMSLIHVMAVQDSEPEEKEFWTPVTIAIISTSTVFLLSVAYFVYKKR